MKTTKNSTWNQKISSVSSLKSDIKYIFKSAKKEQTPHKKILEALKLRVYDNAKYKTLPKYIQSEINGYIDANLDLMYDVLEWAHWYNGKFIGTNLKIDSTFDDGLLDKSSHVYKGTDKCYL